MNCSFCEEGIATCDNCGRYLQNTEDVWCHKVKGKHYCSELCALLYNKIVEAKSVLGKIL